MSEELAFDQLTADRRAVHGHEGAILARAPLVERLRDQLLARPAVTAHEHAQIGLRDLLDHLKDLAHGGTRANQVLEAVLALDALEQHAVLALQPCPFECPRHHHAQLFVVEGLGDVVLRPLLHRLHRDLLGAVRRDHDNRGLRATLLRRAQHVHARRPATEREVRQDQVVGRVRQLALRHLAVVGELDLVSIPPQQSTQRQLDALLVLDDQDPRLHALTSAPACLGNVSTNSVP